MKYSFSYFAIITCLVALYLSLYACAHDHAGHDHSGHDHAAHGSEESGHDGHDHGEGEDHDDHGGNKAVHLNPAQYLNAEIDTGWFVMKNLNDVIHANGYTKLDPQDQAEVSMPVTGTIKSIKVIEGNYVKKGQTLATMMSLELNDKQMDKAKLEEEMGISETKKVYLQKEYERQKALSVDNINARKVVEKVKADLDTELFRIAAVKKQIQIIDQTLSAIGVGQSEYLAIVAPISGHITHIDLKIGATIAAGSTMFEIVDNTKMHVDMLVYEKDLSRVSVGQTVRLILTNQSNQEIQGKIYNIGKSFANDTKSVAVHADIEKNDANLIPGMYINALIDVGENKVKAVPEAAVVMAEGRQFIFLLEKHENMVEIKNENEEEEYEFIRLEVKTGARQMGFVEVTPLGEIHEGEVIVLKGAYYLQSHLQKAEGGGGHHH